jgi:glycine dehydrogenase subunit 2
MKDFPLIFEHSRPGRIATALPEAGVPEVPLDEIVGATHVRREPAALPEVSELDLVRHYTRLSQRNYAIDTGFYPLGSCTMKYNPKVNEDAARLAGFARLHPNTPSSLAQGALELLWRLEQMLCEISGMDRRVDGPDDDPRPPGRARRTPHAGHRPRLGARHQSRLGLDVRVRGRDGPQ